METESREPAPKRIIICCDGTWQSAVSGKANSPSNVTRLARCLERAAADTYGDGKVWQQIVWYDSGVGTTSGWIGQKAEGAFGWGLEGNVIEAYNFVVLNYHPGDQIMCFGFSRGAYTARAIAGLISDIGVCEPRQLHYFHEIWEYYKKTEPGRRFYGSDAYYEWLDGVPAEDDDTEEDSSEDEHPGESPADAQQRKFWKRKSRGGPKWKVPPHGDWAVSAESREIEVIGVYDTVGALGMPSIQGFQFGPDKPGFHNVQLNRNIKRGFQALALDEHREAFTPTLWSLPDNVKTYTEAEIEKQKGVINDAMSQYYSTVDKDEKKKVQKAYNEARRKLIEMEENSKPESELLQVWFPGVHINIGGGSSDTLENKGDLEEISNITFSWMLDQIRRYVGIRDQVIDQERCDRQIHINAYNHLVEAYKRKSKKQEAEAKKSWGKWMTLRSHQAVSAARHYVPFVKGEHIPDERRNDLGWGTGTIIESFTRMYSANGSKPRTPGAYYKDAKHTIVGRTNEQVHPIVGYRICMTEHLKDPELVYKPLNQSEKEERKVVRRQKKDGSWEYVINGDVVLPEYKIRPTKEIKDGTPSFERLAIEGELASQFMKALDKDNGFPDDFEWALSQVGERMESVDVTA